MTLNTYEILISTTTTDLQLKLSYEILDKISEGSDTNSTFKNFLNFYLRIFYSTFIAIEKFKDKDTLNYNFAYCFVWV